MPAPSAPPRQRPITKETLSAFLPRQLSGTPKEVRQRLDTSDFGLDDEATAFDSMLGRPRTTREFAVLVPRFNGETPAAGTADRSSLAVPLAFENAPGRRSPEAYAAAMDQFAVGRNPRYAPDGTASRAHFFVWDVSRALGVEIPHFVRGQEQSLALTCLWMRESSSAQGWVRVDLARGAEHASSGGPCVVTTRDPRLSMLGLVRPVGDALGKPLIAAAGRRRGNALTLVEALGVTQVDCYVHV
jgi:hypothetical protein